ncbi:MerR family transcriptional regulator [Vibrio sp. UCD-FRSSP16_10]|uniref:MerR family transcriptional regulator n=1 Tax=unclassified Vibrio TaxID=2614977 RepID=UPI0007FD4415|nr:MULTISPECIES: MerR family transcriptional regulator [unclassified Vibrio]OBT13928.1 MerR family transcriptional regulator [Vibrio sp. UCD-FRSSP16_30]OBT22809.1 MerR family transcriptional regulator [Vibrio sp. UCD-FRSSP16_10]
MLTVTQLAQQFNLSRTTILYYEREGLLMPTSRTSHGYRLYGEKAVEILSRITEYRAFGVSVKDIGLILKQHNEPLREQILKQQFTQLDQEIKTLRKQQSAIMALLQDQPLLNSEQLTKQQWTEVMRASGLNDEDMKNWHRRFESMQPNGHQKFLESLDINEQEIKTIRAWSNRTD